MGVALGHHRCAWASLVAESGAYSLVAACGLLIVVASLAVQHRLSVQGLSSCISQALEHRLMGLVALLQLESSWTRDWTPVPCTGRQTPSYHCTTREVLAYLLLFRVIILKICLCCGGIKRLFLFLIDSIPLFGYTTICLYIQRFMDIWVASSLGLIQIKLQWTFMCKSLEICYLFSWVNTWEWTGSSW